MLLHPKSSAVEVSSAFDTTSFTIIESQNSFALLQGKQYQNVIVATLRALVENALDAHTDSGTSEKIKIVVQVNNVSVQDHGLGISPEVFENNYTKFFASNRTHSNKYHGFFGVGSKAPLAAAEEFNVRTVYDGTEYLWTCRRGDPNPTATLVAEKKALPGQQGTTVTIPIGYIDKPFKSL